MNSYIPITDSNQQIKIPNFYDDSSSSSPTGCSPCGWFKFSCFNWSKPSEVHSRSLLQDETEHRGESWLVIKMRTLRNLVRRMYRNSEKSKGQFQYDAESYALNFDDGARGEDDGLLCNFSSRFAVPVIGEKY